MVQFNGIEELEQPEVGNGVMEVKVLENPRATPRFSQVPVLCTVPYLFKSFVLLEQE